MFDLGSKHDEIGDVRHERDYLEKKYHELEIMVAWKDDIILQLRKELALKDIILELRKELALKDDIILELRTELIAARFKVSILR